VIAGAGPGGHERQQPEAFAPKAGLGDTAEAWTWHYVENAKTMMLVREDLHDAVISWPPMQRRGPQVTESEIAEFEKRYGHQLPDDYRRFLLDVNGGRLDKSRREFDAGVVNRLFSLNDPEDDSRDLTTRAERARRDLPSPDLLFVGHDDGGARILIALSGEHQGEVWMQITTDARPPDANPRVDWDSRRDMRKLADSFEAFMGSLRPLI